MSKDWTKQLREQLADHKEPVSDDLWAGIEQSLAHTEGSTVHPQNNRTVLFRRYSIAASLAALVAVGTYVELHPWNGEEVLQNGDIAKNERHVVDENHMDKKEETTETHMEDNAAYTVKNVRNGEKLLAFAEKKVDEELKSVMEGYEDGKDYGDVADTGDAAEQKTVTTSKSPVSYGRATYNVSHNPKTYGKSPRLRNWSVQVFGSNGMTGNETAESVMAVSDAVPNFPQYFDDYEDDAYIASEKVTNTLSNLSDLNERVETHHHQPVSVGVQVGYVLDSRLSVSAGLVYTYVSSDFVDEVFFVRQTTTQRLHYVGVPVSLNYNVWQASPLHIYLSVGGEGDVNVKNDTKVDGKRQECQRDRIQWSAHIAAGVQYDVMKQLGVYLEPGVKYYFDNGSKIENVFKDKKLNFNIQLGLRWNIRNK